MGWSTTPLNTDEGELMMTNYGVHSFGLSLDISVHRCIDILDHAHSTIRSSTLAFGGATDSWATVINI
jgi:hypothetical protein